MRILTFIALLTSLVIASNAPNDEKALKAELKSLNQRVLSSISKTGKSRANFIDRESGEIQEGAIRFEQKITKFSGCGLSLSSTSSNRRRRESSYLNAFVPLEHVDLAATRTSIDQNTLVLQFVTVGSKIRVTSFFAGPSIMTGEERQSSSLRLTNRFAIWLQVEAKEDPGSVLKDLLRAVEICKII